MRQCTVAVRARPATFDAVGVEQGNNSPRQFVILQLVTKPGLGTLAQHVLIRPVLTHQTFMDCILDVFFSHSCSHDGSPGWWMNWDELQIEIPSAI